MRLSLRQMHAAMSAPHHILCGATLSGLIAHQRAPIAAQNPPRNNETSDDQKQFAHK
jgi:hypothetical protein